MKKCVALLAFLCAGSVFAGASSSPPVVSDSAMNLPACFVELNTERELVLINARHVQRISAINQTMSIILIGGQRETISYPSKEAAIAAARRFAQSFQNCKAT